MALRKNLMLFEFIATIAAGFGMAGIALIITHLSKLAGKKAPRWLIPLFGAIGIFGFQISQEYSWFEQQTAQLPTNISIRPKSPIQSSIQPKTLPFVSAAAPVVAVGLGLSAALSEILLAADENAKENASGAIAEAND